MKNFLQMLSNLFYTLTPAQTGILTYSCQIVTLHRSQCSSPVYYPAQTQNDQIQQFGGTQESVGTEESNLLGNSVTIGSPILFPLHAQPSGTSEFDKNPDENILFSGNFVCNLSGNESLAEIPVRDNINLTKYLCFETIAQRG